MQELLIGIGGIFLAPAAGALIMIASRVMSNDKIDSIGIGIGKKITDTGRKYFGRFWEYIEDFVLNGILRLVKAIIIGANYDDKIKVKKNDTANDTGK